jgi:hypothetical protein
MKAKRQKGSSGSSDPTPGSAADELPELERAAED